MKYFAVPRSSALFVISVRLASVYSCDTRLQLSSCSPSSLKSNSRTTTTSSPHQAKVSALISGREKAAPRPILEHHFLSLLQIHSAPRIVKTRFQSLLSSFRVLLLHSIAPTGIPAFSTKSHFRHHKSNHNDAAHLAF